MFLLINFEFNIMKIIKIKFFFFVEYLKKKKEVF